MKDHLSEEQFSELALGSAGSETILHLEKCALCRRQDEELRQTLAAFHDSIHVAAKTYERPWRAPAPAARRAWVGFMAPRWAYAAVLAAMLVASVVLLRIDRRQPSHPTLGVISEDEILMQIQTDVDEAVPKALAPGQLLLAGTEEPPAAPAAIKVAGKRRNIRR